MPQLTDEAGIADFDNWAHGQTKMEDFPKDCIICHTCAELANAEWNERMLDSIPFGPWSKGWKGKLCRWLMRLKENADHQISKHQ
jgi:hypothetical protein